ncbi:MAG: hypothetical protein Q8L26_05370 [Candidatus Omnitrophota bacterium]|nr:hypothetical protein [Candidatus Omnitrophota bacterium]
MKKLIIPIIIIAIIAAGIGAFFILQKPAFPQSVSAQRMQKNIRKDSPFGMHGAFSRPFLTDDISFQEVVRMFSETKEPYSHVQDIGARWIRLSSDIYWSTVQPTKEYVENGLYDWSFFDTLHGRVPSGVNTLGTISVGKERTKNNTWEFVNKHVEEKYLEFVKKAVERYDGDGIDDMPGLKNPIKYWQIENEPAIFYEPRFDWQGFSHIVEITYKVIKENDPEAKIALGGLAGGNLVNNFNDPFYPIFPKQLKDFYFPILKNLKDKNIYLDIFDIHYYSGDFSNWPNKWDDSWEDMKDVYNIIRKNLDANGYKNTKIWITETATTEKINGEKAQAASLVKRYIYPLSFGVKKIFWWNMIEGEAPLGDNQPSDHFGLVYDGIGKDDPGYGVKKLSYYTYKKMTEILEGSDWDNIQIVQESNGIYVYKFTKDGKPIWVAWNDNSQEKQVTILGINSKQVKITEAVPKYESGKEVTDYNVAFITKTKAVSGGKATMILKDTPVFAEGI